MFIKTIRGPLRQCLLSLNSVNHSAVACHSTSSIDEKNIKVLADLKDQWWEPMGPMKPLHAMNRMRIPFIREGLINAGSISADNQNTDHVFKGLHFLDVGCGGGILTEALARLKANIVGLEPSPELFEVANARLEDIKHLSLDLAYENRMVEDLCADEKNLNRFDCLVLSEVLEHVNDPATFLSVCMKAVKPGGSLFITTFNKTKISLIGAIWMYEYVLKAIPKGTHEWDKFIHLDDMHKMIENNNCTVLQTTGIFYQPWNNTWRTMENKDMSYAIHAVKH